MARLNYEDVKFFIENMEDKNGNKDAKTKYIASCVYQILNEANSQYTG